MFCESVKLKLIHQDIFKIMKNMVWWKIYYNGFPKLFWSTDNPATDRFVKTDWTGQSRICGCHRSWAEVDRDLQACGKCQLVHVHSNWELTLVWCEKPVRLYYSPLSEPEKRILVIKKKKKKTDWLNCIWFNFPK